MPSNIAKSNDSVMIIIGSFASFTEREKGKRLEKLLRVVDSANDCCVGLNAIFVSRKVGEYAKGRCTNYVSHEVETL